MGYEMEDIAKSLDKLQETVSDHGDRIADAAVQRLEKFATDHYVPTRTGAGA